MPAQSQPEKSSTHTWHQVRTVLWARGYEEVGIEDEFMIFRSRDKFMTLLKSNRLGTAYILFVCNELGIRYNEFLDICAREYTKQMRGIERNTSSASSSEDTE